MEPDDLSSVNVEWQITIALIVAVRDEFVHVREKIATIALPHRDTSVSDDGVDIFYLRTGRYVLRVLFAKTPEPSQGGDSAAWIATMLSERYKPHFIMMIGLCAGNKSAARYRDVIVATSTVRHDFGKLELGGDHPHGSPCFDSAISFQPRIHRLIVNDVLVRALLGYLPQYYRLHGMRTSGPKRGGIKVVLGMMSTGNQVIKVPGVMRYIEQQFAKRTAGDEDKRTLAALEMEAHAMAYAAEKSCVPTLVIKGVCDFADDKKSDHYREHAISNATDVALDILRNVLVTLLPARADREKAIALEADAQRAFYEGDLLRVYDYARQAHALGRRSRMTRRRFIHSLTQFAEYSDAKDALADYRQTHVLDDDLTAELAATILTREGRYSEAASQLSDDRFGERRQLLYLRALSTVLMSGGDRSSLENARTLLARALRIRKSRVPWWIMVTEYWVLRLLDDDQADEAFHRAYAALVKTIDTSSQGTPRLYLLLLLALANKRDEFDSAFAAIRQDASHIQVAMEIVDLVYDRLHILSEQQPSQSKANEYYWMRMCEWLRRARSVGRAVRDETRRLIR